MATWKNLDTLASYSELKDLKDHVNIAEAMSGEQGAERVKKYSTPMAASVSFTLHSRKKLLILQIKYIPVRSQMKTVRNSQLLYRSVSAEVTLDHVHYISHLRTGQKLTTHSRWKQNSSAM